MKHLVLKSLCASLWLGLIAAAAPLRGADEAAAAPATTPAPAPAVGDLDAALDRARQYLGDEATLNAVTSLHFRGSLISPDGGTRTIEIIAQKPMQQLIIEVAGDKRFVSGLDDYDGWRKEGPAERPDAGRIILLSAPEIRRLRASTWQVLYYYRDIEAVGGTITFDGEEEVDGVRCARVVFEHTGGVKFVRLFDVQTGRLMLTRVDDGSVLRESGEIVAGGIRFPKELTTTTGEQTSRVVFETITVNEEFDPERFRIPTPKFDFGRRPSDTSDSAPEPPPAITEPSLDLPESEPLPEPEPGSP